MGARYYTYYPCPKCGQEVEEYNAPSCGMLVAICDKCGWKADNPYLDDDPYPDWQDWESGAPIEKG